MQEALPPMDFLTLTTLTALLEVILEVQEVMEMVPELLEEIIDAPVHPAMRRAVRTAGTSPSSGASEPRQCRWQASSTQRSSASP